MSKSSQERPVETSEGKSKPQKKDWLDILDVLSKLLLTVLGIVFTMTYNRQQDKNRASQETIQMMSQREQSEMDFRQKMFTALLEKLFQSKTSVSVRERLTILRIFQQNLHETLNSRALFEGVYEEAAKEKDYVARTNIIALAKLVSETQESTVEQSIGHKFPSFWMKENDTNTVAINLGSEKKDNWGFVFHRYPGDHSADSSSKKRSHEKPGGQEGHPHLILISVHEIKTNAIKLTIRLRSEEEEAESLYQKEEFGQDATDAMQMDFERTFELDYFDTPFTDNTLLPDGHRLAMTLKDIKEGKDGQLKARVKIIEFPQYYVLSGHRPAMDQLNKMMERTRE